MAGMKERKKTVFGLDIGTRSVVGTVGYQEGERFVVLAQRIKEHETRAMLDGQIHDIKKVGSTILEIKTELEQEVGMKLEDVCIAAAGRVLRTVTTHVDHVFAEEREVTEEDVYGLTAKGVKQAYDEFPNADDEFKFYCVGYSVIRYYINGYPIGNPEAHKAADVGADMILTFLPEDVVDGLYKAVEFADLKVANMTLEPIAAIQVAIPEKFRMLNIALVDVGAGTSDISITKDGAITAYGMIPMAGDALTEIVAKYCLVDFNTADQIKKEIEDGGEISFMDIMGLPQTIAAQELKEELAPTVNEMADKVAECIRTLNGDRSVSAVFVVGGGGKIPGYTEALAERLEIRKERVAVRGEDVMGFIDFPEYVKKDSLLVTPIGICLSFYEQSNNFVFVTFNEKRIKVYDNGKLSVVDAAMQADFPNDALFPKRGVGLEFTVNGKARIKRGELGEAAEISVNGIQADIHTAIKANDVISVTPSTAGEDAKLTVGELPEYRQSLNVKVNGKRVRLPKFAKVNEELKSEYYEITNGDQVKLQDYYTAAQILEFLDVVPPEDSVLLVNNELAGRTTPVYDNFTFSWKSGEKRPQPAQYAMSEEETEEEMETAESVKEPAAEPAPAVEASAAAGLTHDIHILVNGRPVTLSGKVDYVYVDVFDAIDFDLKTPQGNGIVTNLNGEPAEYLRPIKNGDVFDIYWKD